MSTIEEKGKDSVPPHPQQGENKKDTTAQPVSEKAQEILLPSQVKKPSRIIPVNWDLMLKNAAEKILIPKDTVQQVEVYLLTRVLEDGLNHFEDGFGYPTTSKSGEIITILPQDKEGFVKAFFEDITTLFNKSDSSSSLRKKLFSILSTFFNSQSFQSVYPNFKEILEKEKKNVENLSQEELETAYKLQCKKFSESPSLELLAYLFCLNERLTSLRKTETILSSSIKIPLIKSKPPSARPPKRIYQFFSLCARTIINAVKPVFSSLLNSICPSLRSTSILLTMAHARFHRTAIDGKKHMDSYPILDGSFPLVSFNHFMNNDWIPAKTLLQGWKNMPKTTRDTLCNVEKMLDRSACFFHTMPPNAKSLLAEKKIKSLMEGEKLIIPGGMARHAIIYEIEKTTTGIRLKVFNAGLGTEEKGSQFSVPMYTIDEKDTEKILQELFSLETLNRDEIVKKYSIPNATSFLSLAISTIIKTPPTISEWHTLQDRGNCFWKSFSTCMNSQLKKCTISVSSDMVAISKEKAPYAKEDLKILAETKESIPLNRFMHRVAYEKMRAQFTKIFASRKHTLAAYFKKTTLKFFSWAARGSSKSTEKKAADEYISSLVHGIISETAAQRYQRKGLKRRLGSFPSEQ